MAKGTGIRKITTFSKEKKIFSVAENRFYMVKGMFWSFQMIIPENIVPAADNTRASRVKPRSVCQVY